MHAWVTVAELAKAKTLTGGLVARCVPGLPFLLSEGMEVAFVPPQHEAPRRARVVSVQDQGRGAYFVHFDGVENISVAERLAGCRCLVRRVDLPDDALVIETDGLTGFEIRDINAGVIGVVEDVLENPGQVLLSVKRNGGGDNVLIPLVDAFIEGIDEDARLIDVALPDGLLEL